MLNDKIDKDKDSYNYTVGCIKYIVYSASFGTQLKFFNNETCFTDVCRGRCVNHSK